MPECPNKNCYDTFWGRYISLELALELLNYNHESMKLLNEDKGGKLKGVMKYDEETKVDVHC